MGGPSLTRYTLSVLGPLVLPSNLLLLLGSEVIGDVEGLANLLGGLALDHVCDSLASDIEQGLDVEVVRGLGERIRTCVVRGNERLIATYQDDLEEHLLVHLHELLIPLLDVGSLLTSIRLVILSLRGIVAVVLAPLDHLAKDSLVDLHRCGLASLCRQSGPYTTNVGNGDGVVLADTVITNILQHVLDEDRAVGNGTICGQVGDMSALYGNGSRSQGGGA